jgi:hypothetical protein
MTGYAIDRGFGSGIQGLMANRMASHFLTLMAYGTKNERWFTEKIYIIRGM